MFDLKKRQNKLSSKDINQLQNTKQQLNINNNQKDNKNIVLSQLNKKPQKKVTFNDSIQIMQKKQQLKSQNYGSNKKYMINSQFVSFQKGKNNQMKKENIYHQTSEDLVNTYKRQKMPSILKKTLHEQAVNNGRYKRKQSTQKSKFGQMISSKFRKKIQQCGICLGQMKDNQKARIADCSHFFCISCLNQYVFYKIKTFQEIVCPNEQCQKIFDQQNNFYKSLPEDTKTKYIKIHNFYKTSKDPNLRLCPKENCLGIIRIQQNQTVKCNKCLTQFCSKCFFQKHQGFCDQNQINFFQNSLHYRQCSNCKMIIQKNEGCNHIICRCKHQFCYICGGTWSHAHLCNRVPDGFALIQNNQDRTCCNCICLNECETVGGSILCILKFPFRFIIWVFFLMLLIIFNFSTLFIKHLLIFFSVLIIGATLFTIRYLCQLFDQSFLIGTLFLIIFPITLLLGICKAMSQIWKDIITEDFTNMMNQFINLTRFFLCQ